MRVLNKYDNKSVLHWSIPLISAGIVAPIAFLNFALFHTLIELFSISVAMMGFVVVWHTRNLSANPLFLHLGFGYLCVGVLDLAHTLTFNDLFGLGHLETSRTVEYWICARMTEALIIICAPFLVQINRPNTYLLPTIPLILSILLIQTNSVPLLYSKESGLSYFKIGAEYSVVALLAFAIAIYQSRKVELGSKVTDLITISCVLTIAAELCFTLYDQMDGWPFIIGHLLKFLSFWSVYHLLIDSAMLRPIDNLSKIVDSYDSVKDPTAIVDQNGIILRANSALKQKFGNNLTGKHCHDLMHPSYISIDECAICQAISTQTTIQGYEFEDIETGNWYEARVSGIHFTDQQSAMIHSLQEINLRKRAEHQYQNLNRLYQVLSNVSRAITNTPSQSALFSEICQIAVNQGKFKMVWIGHVDGQIVRPTYSAGDENGYLSNTQMRIDDSEWARGPVGIAAKTKRVSCVNNVDTDPNFTPWRAAAKERNYAALAAVPISVDKKVIAILTLYSDSKDVFDEAMLQLLRTLGNDLGRTVKNIQQRELKVQADQTISKLSSAVEQSSVATIMCDADGKIEYINPRFCELMEFKYQDLIGKDHRKLLTYLWSQEEYDSLYETMQSGEVWQREIQSKSAKGNRAWLIQTASVVRNQSGKVTQYVVNASDNTQLRQAHETIEKLAFYDPLTNLPNRRLLMDRLEHAIANAVRHNELVAVMMCDLDNFKTVNDSLGHDYGDALLKSVADTFKKSTREVDTVSRLGGDEFVLVLEVIREIEDVIIIAKNIQAQLSKPINLDGVQISVSSSIGIALAPQDGLDATEILRNADLAMYNAKNQGKNDFKFFQQEMNEQAKGRLQLENDLRLALANNEFHLVYQPQVEMTTGRIIGVETLLRWKHPDKGLISPELFVPIAEQTGIIESIGEWVLNKSIEDWSAFRQAGMSMLRLAVNFSGKQFKHSLALPALISNAITAYQELSLSDFTVEITESTLIHDISETKLILSELKELGVDISIDDFGTGYSSLGYLKEFPIDQLKIDKTFVQGITDDASDQAIISAIIAIAHELDIKVIAEGIETTEQQNVLLGKHCTLAQGYKYYKPMTKEQLLELAQTV